ncbi:DUF1521 domain-containing protein [Caballeronia fortuita]|nr:DUF1521 domain-containing protein [Caballeronia fortuita]
MSSSSFSYTAQQMSRTPDRFSDYFASGGATSFERQGPFGNTSYSHMESTSYMDQGYTSPYGGYETGSGSGQCNRWSDSGVQDGKSSIDLGDYKLAFDKSDSSMLLTNKQSGDATKIWGDPHIDLHSGAGNQQSGMFNGPLTFSLPDSTTVAVGTEPANGNPGVSYADSVKITQGNRAYVVGGLSQQDSAPLTVQRGDASAAGPAPTGGYQLIANPNGSGWINAQTHQEAQASDFHA